MFSISHRKFCEGVVTCLSFTDANKTSARCGEAAGSAQIGAHRFFLSVLLLLSGSYSLPSSFNSPSRTGGSRYCLRVLIQIRRFSCGIDGRKSGFDQLLLRLFDRQSNYITVLIFWPVLQNVLPLFPQLDDFQQRLPRRRSRPRRRRPQLPDQRGRCRGQR